MAKAQIDLMGVGGISFSQHDENWFTISQGGSKTITCSFPIKMLTLCYAATNYYYSRLYTITDDGSIDDMTGNNNSSFSTGTASTDITLNGNSFTFVMPVGWGNGNVTWRAYG